MENCIFCKIVNNDIKANTIYEDEKVKVFLDANPITNGHMLIIPKAHRTNILDMEDELILHSVKLIKEKLYPLLKEKLHCDGVTISQNNEYGQEIKHFHIHVIPRYTDDQDTHIYNKDMLIPIDDVYSKLMSK